MRPTSCTRSTQNRRTAMKRLLTVAALVAAGSLIAIQAAAADDAAMIKSAESAAPPAVASGAAIHAMDEKGAMRTLREGTNGFWCMPDNPATPGPDPMCGDANSMEWAMAWIEKKNRPRARSASCICWPAAPTAATPILMRRSPSPATIGWRPDRT
ncbi:exported hypothetical protein [Mesorhizobium delmotii]|uniref:Uncharacterized protein n=1 Tax=Mesorhizobium delmotii TaxID=1631247 RepID=A0A2P9AAR5_9HYPH|nr:exported hypothetical protein [Mesorhizobium delmotii]